MNANSLDHYEERAAQKMDSGDWEAAQVFATLAVAAAIQKGWNTHLLASQV